MKRKSILSALIVGAGLSLAALTQSCVSDAPFARTEGEGTLRMSLVVNSELKTRAEVNDDALRDSCVVYISGASGLLHKYKGLLNVPSEIMLRSGNYVAEAWTGDSVPASFDHVFYRGYQPFVIQQGGNTAVSLVCYIANVVVSVNPESTDIAELGDDWTLTVQNSSGSLEFTRDNMASAKGYFMMPNADIKLGSDGSPMKGSDGWTLYNNLTYKLEGTDVAGEPFVKEGVIEGNLGNGIVEHAHEYRLNFQYTPEYEDLGGGFITIKVVDEEIEPIEHDFGIYSAPAIKGMEFNIENQVVGSEGGFPNDLLVKVAGFEALESIVLSSDDYADFGIPSSGADLLKLASTGERDELRAAGIEWTDPLRDDRNIWTSYITLRKSLLDNLAERNSEYTLNIYAKDGYGKSRTVALRIAVGEGAVVVDAPITFQAITDPMAVRLESATLTGTFNGDPTGVEVQYRKKGSVAWGTAQMSRSASRSGEVFTAVIDGLTEGTTYEYRAYSEDYQNGEAAGTFTTESRYSIPNAGMESWSQYNNKIWFPGTSYDSNNFWDTGNHGSATLNNTMLTVSDGSIKNGGNYSAKLESKFVGVAMLGKFAAGNLFAGQFGQTVGTSGAKLTFGRPYNGSHPEKLAVYVNYTPTKISSTDNKSSNPVVAGLTTSDWDEGQIFVAFATNPISLNTADGIYFNPDDPAVLGYGQVTFSNGQNIGESGRMARVEIPVEWRQAAHSQEATTIIIVCSASKYGDYFVGGKGSIMYLDDFELVY